MNKRVWSCEDHHFLLCHCNLHKFVIPEWLFLPIRVIGIITDCYTSSQFLNVSKYSTLKFVLEQRTWESLVLPSTLDNFGSKTHMRWPSHNATKILCARTFTFQFKLLGFSFTSLTHFRSPLANFADRVITKKKRRHPLYMYNI
ncbi:hypothetical protein DY000_02024339 [Brassica cretica]|uniref:F-box associated domain-containing protein n=1 Tax=Brassica cretica TaxID=69181 RepID=A0ABQ7E1K4_BRACR|nr:hypothetical protein DY000_02024339 [Brassica cretica]